MPETEMKKETYKEMKRRHEKEYNDFVKDSMFFAFSNEQFDKGLEKLNISKEEAKEKICSTGAGGYLLKTKVQERRDIFKRWEEEQKELTKDFNFAKEMFLYELQNHEYCITYDLTDTLDALGYTIEEINNNPTLFEALKHAELIASRYN